MLANCDRFIKVLQHCEYIQSTIISFGKTQLVLYV